MKEFSFTDWKNATGMAIDIVKKGLTVDEQKKVVDVLNYSVDLKSEIITLKERINALREENSRLKEEASVERYFEHDGKVYWLNGNDGTKSGPYCPACWGANKLKIHMTVGRHTYKCPHCKHDVVHTDYPLPPPMEPYHPFGR